MHTMLLMCRLRPYTPCLMIVHGAKIVIVFACFFAVVELQLLQKPNENTHTTSEPDTINKQGMIVHNQHIISIVDI